MGMKNHELVNGKLVAAIAQLGGGGAHKILMRLSKERLIGPVSFIAWDEEACGRVIFVMIEYYVSPGIFFIVHSTELVD